MGEEVQRQTEGLIEKTLALAAYALLFFKVTRKTVLILDGELGLGSAPGCGRQALWLADGNRDVGTSPSPDGTVNLSKVPAQPGSGCHECRGHPLEADLPGQRGALSGQSCEEVSVCGHVAPRLPVLTTKNRLPQASSLQNGGGEASYASSHILQLLFLLPAGVVGVTSGRRVSFKKKREQRRAETQVNKHLGQVACGNSPGSGIQKTLSTHDFDILAVGLWAS
ncbi:uncharacterized protein LOC119811834 isoform X2 [Arvicola amphibius]|uniref:uncharacterized protein LOC119811834 isoform X2 n=1 Tax=Arvicola amphibius TaxID=1047088 RepID=UPI0018E2D851|nr:uncharacterized protein LOC119811834 isoform X2 [Arvicola amphibius]